MRKWQSFSLLFNLIFTIFYCTKPINTVYIKPLKVELISGVSDTCQVEIGIDAIPEGDKIHLEWIPNSEEEVVAYKIYRSTEKLGTYNLISRRIHPDSSYEDGTVTVETRYYYYILAETDESILSEPSDTLNYKLIRKATTWTTTSETDSSKTNFNWIDKNSYAAPYYVIRLLEKKSGEYIWISRIETKFGTNIQRTFFNENGSAKINTLLPNVEYLWRIDIAGSEDNSGSESEWKTLLIQ